jgi:hypothetical protein
MRASLLNSLYTGFHLLAFAALVVMLARPTWRDAFQRRCVGDATATDLAWVRIVVCAISILYLLNEDLVSMARLGKTWFEAPGYLTFIGRRAFYGLMTSEGRLIALTSITIGLLVLAMLGIYARVTLPLAALACLLCAGLLRSFGKWFHDGYLSLYVLAVLCFLPCADAWSLDARWRRRPAAAVPAETPAAGQAAYGWSVWACYAAACVPYLQLAFSKLTWGGFFWFDGRSLRNYMLVDCLNLSDLQADLPLRFLHTPTFMFTALGLFGLLTELLYPAVLVFPRLRRVLPFCVAGLHLGVLLCQDALFLDAILLPLIFLRPSRWRWRRA